MSVNAIRFDPTDSIHTFFVTGPLLCIDKVKVAISEVFYFLGAFFTYLFSGNSRNQLIEAAQEGYELTTRFFLWLDVDINSQTQANETALHLAAKVGHLNIVQLLAGQPGVNLDLLNRDNMTALEVAIDSGHTDTAQILADSLGSRLNSLDERNGEALLHKAARNGKLNIVQFLARQDTVDLSQKDQNGMTPLHVAALHGQLDVVRFLTPLINANLVDNFGTTPVFLAASEGHLPVVQFFADHPDIELNLVDNQGVTLIQEAATNNQLFILAFLSVHPKVRLVDARAALNIIQDYQQALFELQEVALQ